MKKSNIYTRTGDNGTTSLVSGTRVGKNTPRLQAYGTIDELNSHIGLLASHTTALPQGTLDTLTTVQNTLFNIGAILATEPQSTWQPAPVTQQQIQTLEDEIDRIDSQLPRHNRFILPGGCTAAAQAHVARTVARRAERHMLNVDYTTPTGHPSHDDDNTTPTGHPSHDDDNTTPTTTPTATSALRYINRLSDYLFVLARQINKFNNIDEIFWQKDC